MPYNTCVRETGVTVKLEGAEMVKLTERRRNGSDDVLQGMLRNAMMKYWSSGEIISGLRLCAFWLVFFGGAGVVNNELWFPFMFMCYAVFWTDNVADQKKMHINPRISLV